MASLKGFAQAGAAGLAGRVVLRRADAAHRVGDRAVAGAAAEIALERARQVGPLRLVEGGHGHDHAGGAEAALEALRVQEGLLHRVQSVRLAPAPGSSSRRGPRRGRPASGRNAPARRPARPCRRRNRRRRSPSSRRARPGRAGRCAGTGRASGSAVTDRPSIGVVGRSLADRSCRLSRRAARRGSARRSRA